jgi:hypothetical protein
VAKPIPINDAGLRPRRRLDARAFAPILGVDYQIPPSPPDVASDNRPSFIRQVLLLISGLAGGLAVISALGLWKDLAATRLGMGNQGAFCLLVAGVYLLATTLYAAWKTRLLNNLNQAPWDARLMAYANLAVGGSIILTLGVVVLAIVAVVVALAWFVALLLSGRRGRPQD